MEVEENHARVESMTTKRTHCEICRVPHALMPCSRCALPEARTSLPPSPNRPPRSSAPILLEGKYRLLDELGRGGMGTVFRAIDESLDRMVAIKFLLPEIQAMPIAVERFRREARAMAKINDHNVVRVFTLGRYGAADFFVTEFIDGPTVEDRLDTAHRRGDLVPLSAAIDILVQASAGLTAVHRAGVVHRDIKPGNVMVEQATGRVLIMDFGIGRHIEREANHEAVGVGGTPAYMAPEIISNLELSPSQEMLVDIYALGVTAFELLTNQLPFEADTWVEVLEKHLDEVPRTPSSLRADLPAELDDIVLRCMKKDPSERFRSADELHRALVSSALNVLDGEAPSFPTLTAAQRTRPQIAATTSEPIQVVIVEPEPLFRERLFAAASEVIPEGRFLAASSSEEALQLRDDSMPVILVSSLHDRALNGLELVASLSEELSDGRMAVVLTTSEITEAERRLLSRLGATQVVVKSIGPVETEAVLSRAVATLTRTRTSTK